MAGNGLVGMFPGLKAKLQRLADQVREQNKGKEPVPVIMAGGGEGGSTGQQR